MSRTTIFLALISLLLVPAIVGAEQVRLRNGQLLQGEILGEQSDEEMLRIRLYSTGGEFSLAWNDLIEEDETRLRDILGLTPWEEADVPMVPGHQVVFVNGNVQLGVAENPDDKSRPLALRTATGLREYPWDTIAGVKPAMVPALEVYSPDELYQTFLEEGEPETAGGHVDLAKRLIQVEAYGKAKEHLDTALADEEFRETEAAQAVRNLLARVEVFLKAEDALARVRDIKKYAFQKKFDTALDELTKVRDEYAEDAAILKLLRLDRLEKKLRSDRRSHFVKQVQRRFFYELNDLVNKKVREKDVTINEVIQWIQNPKGLGQEIFSAISEDLEISEDEAREFWEARTSRQVHRYNYGTGTFYHPEVAARTRKVTQPRRSGSRSSRSSRSSSSGGRTQKQQQKPKSGDEWWTKAKSKTRENFAKAWFAEFGNVLTMLRAEVHQCKSCGGKGIQISISTASSEEIRTICPVCNLSGHERVVVAR